MRIYKFKQMIWSQLIAAPNMLEAMKKFDRLCKKECKENFNRYKRIEQEPISIEFLGEPE